MARYGQRFKEQAVARMLPPESTPLQTLSVELGVSEATLERWCNDPPEPAQFRPLTGY